MEVWFKIVCVEHRASYAYAYLANSTSLKLTLLPTTLLLREALLYRIGGDGGKSPTASG